MVMSGRSIFLGRLRPPKRLTSTSLTSIFLESAGGETKPDRVSNPGPLAHELDALPIALPCPASLLRKMAKLYMYIIIELRSLLYVNISITSMYSCV